MSFKRASSLTNLCSQENYLKGCTAIFRRRDKESEDSTKMMYFSKGSNLPIKFLFLQYSNAPYNILYIQCTTHGGVHLCVRKINRKVMQKRGNIKWDENQESYQITKNIGRVNTSIGVLLKGQI